MDQSFIRSAGGLLSHDFLSRLRQRGTTERGCAPGDFILRSKPAPKAGDVEESLGAAWELLLGQWDRVRAGILQFETGATRSRWLTPLLEVLDHDLQYQRSGLMVEDAIFPISHRGSGGGDAPAMHLVAATTDLDLRQEGVRRGRSPHDLLQGFLNASGERWGLVGNGLRLRLLRQYPHTSQRGFVEFDLQSIFETRNFDDFRALYRLCHASRFIRRHRLPRRDGSGEEPACALDLLYAVSQSAGVAVGGKLRDNVRLALEALGNGLLAEAPELRLRLQTEREACRVFYEALLRVVYRLLFLLFAEQRGLMPGRDTLYQREYSITRLREIAESGAAAGDTHLDLWEGLRVTFRLVGEGVLALGIHGYDGMLFDGAALGVLDGLACPNADLLQAVDYLTRVDLDGVRQRISFVDLGVRELGSVYESLLDYAPAVSGDQAVEPEPGNHVAPNRFFLDSRGRSRKGSGSYYTHETLVEQLIETSLRPVIAHRLREAGADSSAQRRALLSIRVVDPACGSGHFLVAAMHELGLHLARLDTGTESPGEEELRRARREVLQRCIYAVDLNPMALELCKVALWIDAAVQDKPLNFLDHHLRCGNSLLGATPEGLAAGIPDEAYKATGDDDAALSRAARSRNRRERLELGRRIHVTASGIDLATLARGFAAVGDLAEDSAVQVAAKREAYRDRRRDPALRQAYLASDLWTAAFFWELRPGNPPPPTTAEIHVLLQPQERARSWVDAELEAKLPVAEVLAGAGGHRFFHWHLEFPEVFAAADPTRRAPGFDVVLGNPPWERIKLQEEEFFESRAPEIAGARNAAERKRLIAALPALDPGLAAEFGTAVARAERTANFARTSGRYPRTGVGDVNLYALFVGLGEGISARRGRVGMVVPSGIATDFTYQDFFRSVIQTRRLHSVYQFQNERHLFPDVHHSMSFCLLTLDQAAATQAAEFAFGLWGVGELDAERRYGLDGADFALINPNTGTCPTFKTRRDADLVRKIYRRCPVLVRQGGPVGNPWGASFMTMFHMANDSGLFRTREQLERHGFELDGTRFLGAKEVYLPLYEAKMMHQYDHRHGTYEGVSGQDLRDGYCRELTEEERAQGAPVLPRYWVSETEVASRLPPGQGNRPLLAFRDIARATDQRTVIAALLPGVAANHKAPLIFTEPGVPRGLLLANLDALVLDFVARQKLGGTNLSYFILQQLPIFPPARYPADAAARIRELVARLVAPLTLDGIPAAPCAGWDPAQRLAWRAEIDALYFDLYGLEDAEVEYVLDHFRVMAEREVARYGEYRTRRLVREHLARRDQGATGTRQRPPDA